MSKFSKETEVVMYNGKLKRIEDITCSDRVMGADGKPKGVIAVNRGYSEMVEIYQSNADNYVVSRNAMLSLMVKYPYLRINGRYDGDVFDVDLGEYLNYSKWYRQWIKGYKGSYNFHANQRLRIPPYILGLWLGDGGSDNANFTVCKREEQILFDLEEYARKIGHLLYKKDGHGECWDVRIRPTSGYRADNVLYKALVHYNLIKNKHIPSVYFNTSKNQRIELLAGLINTDGWGRTDRNRWYVGFGNTNLGLVEGVKQIADSLGYRTKMHKSVDRGYVKVGNRICLRKDFWCLYIRGFDSDRLLPHKRTE